MASGFRACEEITFNAEAAEDAEKCLRISQRALRALGSNGSAIMFRRAADPSLICPNDKQGGTWDVFFWVKDVQAL